MGYKIKFKKETGLKDIKINSLSEITEKFPWDIFETIKDAQFAVKHIYDDEYCGYLIGEYCESQIYWYSPNGIEEKRKIRIRNINNRLEEIENEKLMLFMELKELEK